jgi:hypothetical protein
MTKLDTTRTIATNSMSHDAPRQPQRKAPDSIMAELWRVKAQINARADYSVEKILDNAREAAKARVNALAG